MAIKKKAEETGIVEIRPANLVVTTIDIASLTQLVMEKFSDKTIRELMAGMSATAAQRKERKNKAARPSRDYDQEFKDAQHRATAGWPGIPCTAFRWAMVDACRMANVVMVTAKLAITILPDGFDADDGTPLVRLHSPHPPEQVPMPVRNANGSVDIRVRPVWRQWSAHVNVQYDADMITADSIVNLLDRAGRQVGICAGRPFSKKSVGQGWGTFAVNTAAEEKTA